MTSRITLEGARMEMARTIAGRQSLIAHQLLDYCAVADIDIVGARVLDCGGGTGAVAVELARAGAEVTVADLNADALATLRRRAIDAGVERRVYPVAVDVESPDFLGVVASARGNDGVDLVVVHELLEALSGLRSATALVGALAASLRPGGLMSIVAANPVSSVLGHVIAGDYSAALALMARLTGDEPTASVAGGVGQSEAPLRMGVADIQALCSSVGLVVSQVHGLGIFADTLNAAAHVPTPDDADLLAELERMGAATSPFRDIADRLWVMAERTS